MLITKVVDPTSLNATVISVLLQEIIQPEHLTPLMQSLLDALVIKTILGTQEGWVDMLQIVFARQAGCPRATEANAYVCAGLKLPLEDWCSACLLRRVLREGR